MSQALHSQARTTHLIRAEIRQSDLPQKALATRYNVTRKTIGKWQNREQVEDKSHCPHTLHTTLSKEQEVLVVALRTVLLLPTDDLLSVTRQFINPRVSRSGLGRCLRRYGISDLRTLIPQDSTTKPVKTFKDYEPGFIYVDIKYLPKMPDETEHRYLFVAIDRATRWVFLSIYPNQSNDSSADFLCKLEKACPIQITKLLTDNGNQFTDRFTSQKKTPTGQHLFDRICKKFNIEHRLIPPRHPQTNGMVERFNGRISELTHQTRFASSVELEKTLLHSLKIYNHHIPQRALDHQTPILALKLWHKKKPDLFVKCVYDYAGLDTSTCPHDRGHLGRTTHRAPQPRLHGDRGTRIDCQERQGASDPSTAKKQTWSSVKRRHMPKPRARPIGASTQPDAGANNGRTRRGLCHGYKEKRAGLQDQLEGLQAALGHRLLRHPDQLTRLLL